jgi:hypothetical protein
MMLALITFLQSTSMTDAEFKVVLAKVVVFGTIAMAIAGFLLWMFWRNLGKESAEGGVETKTSTWLLLVSLIVVLLGLSFVVYSLA